MIRQEDDALAGELVIGLLDEAERARCEARIARDPDFAARVEHWRHRFAELDATARPEHPAQDLWARIAATVAQERPAAEATVVPFAAPPAARRPLWDNLPLWRGVGLGAMAAALVLAVGLGLMVRTAGRTPVLVAVLLSDQNRPAAVVNAFADGRTELVPLEALSAPEGKSLQVWTLWDRSRGPVSVGLLNALRSLDLNVEHLPRTATDQLFEVTLEPAGGSPTGRPTGPILMKGNASRTL
ncbi:DNA-directed RNA polymerase sigma-70 factor [Azorhizobium oxalatiphilum]|uniref:DNA-directed RNA polymerase sigma-70 factor n=1 Tax=Azorhizobium oxalatiphilum TaxID=980631 RepID=A0A917CAN9_9HYPH|nr:anti-sigma factor [Azorhizobium oxalatiphilum]GGF79775.1 DNA-directed RNA polymerase sigma-70 factor [Azorhizobium oxalatiphilum]